MKVPISWLKEYTDINLEAEELAKRLTMTGTKLEGIISAGEDIKGVVTAKVMMIKKHPKADKLLIASVDIGDGKRIQVLTGAANVKEGDCVPVAVDGAELPGGKRITEVTYRDELSQGMMCSLQELNLSKDDYPQAAEDGIFILDGDISGIRPGTDICKALGLDEQVMDFEITPNRPDCLSVLGVAREAAAAMKTTFRKPFIEVMADNAADNAADDASSGITVKPVDNARTGSVVSSGTGIDAQMASVEIKDTDLCPRYAARMITDVRIGPSPEWMQKRLKLAGMRPINNIVDITNYVMLELGQPMHAFDLARVKKGRIIVRRAADGESITTIDGQQRDLDTDMLVITDPAGVIAVAGVMGGAGSEISESTRQILFESANFNGISVRLTAKRLGMRTEASQRFEKGLDPENTITAVNRAVQLVERIGAGRVVPGIIDCKGGFELPGIIHLRPERINALLGTDITAEEMADILDRIEFDVDLRAMTVAVPSFRRDVRTEADLAEEVARFYGYNTIRPTLLDAKNTTMGILNRRQKLAALIKSTMQSCGVSEAYTFSFTGPAVFDRMRIPKGDAARDAMKIMNPRGEEFSIMRTTAMPEMLECISMNNSRGASDASLYELGRIYLKKSGSEVPHERLTLTIGMYGEGADFYSMKGIIETLLDVLGIKDYTIASTKGSDPSFHSGRSAFICIEGRRAGVFGEIHPETAISFECPEMTYLAHIDAEELIGSAVLERRYTGLPRFPAISRDLALVTDDTTEAGSLAELMRETGGQLLCEISLFDIYRGKQVPDGKKSLAYTLRFRAPDRTLKDQEVDEVIGAILKALGSRFGAFLRE